MDFSNKDIKNCIFALKNSIRYHADLEKQLTSGDLKEEIREMRISMEETLKQLKEDYRKRIFD